MADIAVAPPAPMETDAEAPAEETKTPAKRGGKSRQKTPKATKAASPAKKQKKAASDQHPKYSQMIEEAIAALKDRNGSSRQAILKYIIANYNVLSDEKAVNNHLKMSLRAGVKNGKLRQSKGSGANGSYKLAEKNAPKAVKAKAEKKTKSPSKKASLTKVKVPKTPATKKSKSPAKKASSAKTSEKTSPKKTAAKKSKSPAKKATKTAKSPKKTPAKKAAKSPKKTPKTPKSAKSAEAPAEAAPPAEAPADAPAPEPAAETASA